MKEKYCCDIRRHFVIGIVGTRRDTEAPVDVADFVIAWEPKVIIRIKYCPFCREEIAPEETMRITGC